MPHDTFDQTRAQNEHIVFSLQPHWLQLASASANALLGILFASTGLALHLFDLAILSPFFYVIALAFETRATYLGVLVFNQEILLSNHRISHKTGLINRNTEELRLSAIETVEIRQSILQRLFNSGDLHITGRGSSDLYLRNISNPLHAKQIIETQLEAFEQSSDAHTRYRSTTG